MSNNSFMFPVSFAQRRLWFVDQLVPENAFYNLHSAVAIRTPLDCAALEHAINELVRRHESLRTTFVVIDDEPMQCVSEKLDIALPVVDLRKLNDAARRTAAEEATRQEAQQPFDLSTGPLIRTRLLRLANEEYLFVVTMHHIVSDGWSMGVFWRELSALYNAFALGRPSPLPELPIQYADFAVWQHDWLRGPALQSQIDYWRGQLDQLPTLDLPTDRPRPPVATYRGAQHPVILRADLYAQLRSLSQRHETTLFMTLMASFATLLSRYSGQTDIVIGVPTAGRTRSELEGLIGFFVNTLVMRCDLSGDPAFDDLLQRIRQVALGAYSNQDLPFEKLVEELQPERDLSRNPLFQVTFQLLASTAPAAAWGDAPTPVHRGSAAFDLSLNLWDNGTEIRGHIEYGTDLFDAETIARMGTHFDILLRDIVGNERQALSAFELIDERERRLLLVEWNRTEAELPEGFTLLAAFEAQAARTPNRVALICNGATLSYRALDRRANALARRLKQHGVTPGDAVAICLPRGLELVTAMLAAWKTGAGYMPLDLAFPDERLRMLLDRSDARAIVVNEDSAARVQHAHAKFVELAGMGEADALPPAAMAAGALACVLFTSGSTGVPKGAEITHGGLLNIVQWHQREFAVSAEDRASQLAGASFDACGWELWPYLTVGACVVVVDDDTRASPRALIDWMARERITIGFVPTPLVELLVQESMPTNLSLRALVTGGDRLHCAPPAGLPFTLYNNYGPTETTIISTSTPVPPETVGAPSIGRPIANTWLYVLDSTRRPVPIGVYGELYIGGVGVTRGYRGDPERTAQQYIDNPFATSPINARLYRSGDIVRYRRDGYLEFRGRIDRQVKIRGNRVELGEIECTLLLHPSVKKAAVAWRPSERGEHVLVAYVVPVDAADADGEAAAALTKALRNFVAMHLPTYAVPASMVMRENLPVTSNGKIDLRALPMPTLAPGTAATGEAMLQGEVETSIAGVFCEVLSCEPVGRNDHFFADLGGHSLLATQLLSRVRNMYDIDLPLRAFFGAPTVAALARLVEDALIEQIDKLSNEDAARLALQA